MMEGGPVVLFLLLLTNLVFVAGTNFSFPSFQADDGSLLKVDDVRWSSTLQSFELNYRTYATGLLDQECGRLLYKDRVRLFDRRSGIVASFNTSFSFAFQQFDANSTSCGAGLAFTFVPGTTITEREYSRRGKGMCAFDNADTSESNRVVAIKFDSALTNVTGYNDPSDSNIGVVVTDRGNTTEHTYNLCGARNITECAFFCGNKGVFSAWIDYDSASQVLEVRFRAGSLFSGGGKPGLALIRVTDLRFDSDVLEDEEMYVGFSGSTFWSREVHRIRAWSFSSTPVPTSPDHPPRPPLVAIIGITCAAVFGVCLVGTIIVFFFWHKRSSSSFSPQKNLSFSNTAPRSFTYKELRKATKNFSATELLSSGSFGDVYKGTLPSGALVAVKRIKSSNEEGEESFLAEATSLRQIRHRNLLQLRGWCQAKQGLLLVYDYLSNGSLDKWLHKTNSRGNIPDSSFQALPWSVRRFILAGVASALAYLHEEWVQCILHRDIKSSNVMLDANFNAHLGDFGLARLVDHHKVEKTTLLAGTLGYMAPEMTYTGRATKETDIYAFGILLLEVVCGRRPLAVQEQDAVLLDCVWRAYEAGNLLAVADQRLTDKEKVIEEEEKVIVRTLELGLLCCHPNPAERPSMRTVNQWFQAAGLIDLPALPATRPYSQYSDMVLGLRTLESSTGATSTSTVNSFQQWASSDTGSF